MTMVEEQERFCRKELYEKCRRTIASVSLLQGQQMNMLSKSLHFVEISTTLEWL